MPVGQSLKKTRNGTNELFFIASLNLEGCFFSNGAKGVMQADLPIIQKTYDLIKWYVPILNRLPRDHRFLLGDRMIAVLYDLLENLVLARYEQDKLPRLKPLNGRLDILRYQLVGWARPTTSFRQIPPIPLRQTDPQT